MFHKRILIFLPVIILLFSCGKKKEMISEDILMEFGDRRITLQEVEELIPGGITATDSVALFNAILEGWIKEAVLSDFAEERLYDLSAIEQQVNNYRNTLIIQEYLNRMKETRNPKIDENRVKDYYDTHKTEMKLEVPLVKGIFLKLPVVDNPEEDIYELLNSESPQSIDTLEQKWLDKAEEYIYFRDKWIDWESLSDRIPYRFGDPDLFLKENKYFQTISGDNAYYLQISEFIPSGEQQPFEFAHQWISDILTQSSLAEYERVLVNSLVDKAIKDHKLKMVGYDIKTQEIKVKQNIK